MSALSIVLIAIIALLAGMEGVLDEFQFHQPLVACTLIGLVSGHLQEGVMLGGSLQMMALGWANVGAAVAPDAALASVASAIIMVLALDGGTADSQTAITTSIALAVPLSVAGLFLTMICRTLSIPMVHAMDAAAEKGDFKGHREVADLGHPHAGRPHHDPGRGPVLRLARDRDQRAQHDAGLVVRWHGHRRRHGRFRRLRHGH